MKIFFAKNEKKWSGDDEYRSLLKNFVETKKMG